jgi:AcrR family transcriptional regulator
MPRPLLHRDDPAAAPLVGNIKVTRADWLAQALDVLIRDGVDQVKVAVLAARMNVSRSSFYWYFKSRGALLQALLAHWQDSNTAAMLDQASAPAASITGAVCNIFRCTANPDLFDIALDFAVRDWARRDVAVRGLLEASDTRRVEALREMFTRFGYGGAEALTRARVLYYMQLGYDTAGLNEPAEARLTMVPHYLRVFTGVEPRAREIEEFNVYARRYWGDNKGEQA